ncbi:MAG: DUF1634 domain-containing protein [Planctomycetota bacterium]
MSNDAAPPPPDPSTPPVPDTPAAEAEANRERKIAEERIHRTELIISYVLRTGVLISLALMLLGIVVTFARNSSDWNSKASYTRQILWQQDVEPAFPHTLNAIWQGLGHGDGLSIMALGLLVLIATPVVRVAISIVTFVYMRDRAYTVITTLVLIFLILSFLLGKIG